MSIRHLFIFVCFGLLFLSCEDTPPPPVIDSIDPTFGPAETLVTIEGTNLANITEVTFSGQVVNFNNAYNSDRALLLRIPTNVPLGEHEVVLTTKGGSATTNFKVSLDPPEIFSISPEAAFPGDVVTIYGKNFFAPLEVYFFDSIQAVIIAETPDSLLVQVPEDIEKGHVTVVANGGVALSPVDFFIENTILVNDFDGNGLRAQTNQWIFVGEIDQNALNAVHDSNPDPIDNNFLKLSGQDNLDISWIGGAQTNFGFPGDEFETFGIRTSPNNTLLEMDVNHNGHENTYIILILLENDGSPNDFTHKIKLDKDGWDRLSIPLNRFKDIDEVLVDPTKVRTLKIHLIDEEDTNTQLEVNVDNISFVEIL